MNSTPSPTEAEAGELLDRARRVAGNAYAPYSGFRVGAVAVVGDRIYEGVNVENAAYGSTICAEANALTTAATNGLLSVPVVAVGCLDADECTPCGNCRQLMVEFQVEWVVLQGQGGRVRLARLQDLLPDAFGPGSLPG